MVKTIDVRQFESMQFFFPLDVIDVRPFPAFASGAIPGARSARALFDLLVDREREGLPGFRRDLVALTNALGLAPSRPVVVYEARLDSGLGASCRGALLLKWIGFRDVAVLESGYDGWLSREDEPSSAPVMTTSLTAPTYAEAIINARGVQAALNDSETDIVDVRDPDEWSGASGVPSGQPPVRPPGRIPNAKWLHWRRLIGENARFLSSDAILGIARSAGLDPDRRTILYCYRGARAANTWLALKRAGFSKLQLYLGSWNEWSAGGHPIAGCPSQA